MIQLIRYRVTNSDVEAVQPTSPYEPLKNVKIKRQSNHPIRGKPLSFDESSNKAFETLPQKVALDAYKLDPTLEKILNRGKCSKIEKIKNNLDGNAIL